MIIRSQNKKSIVNIDNTFEISVHDKKVVVSGSYSAVGLLGTYSTEEKAIKVLDMIQKEYGRHYYGEGGSLATINHYVEPFAFIPPKVFQMPSDEEVEV